jgi:hypothetical protein
MVNGMNFSNLQYLLHNHNPLYWCNESVKRAAISECLKVAATRGRHLQPAFERCVASVIGDCEKTGATYIMSAACQAMCISASIYVLLRVGRGVSAIINHALNQIPAPNIEGAQVAEVQLFARMLLAG